MEGRSKMTTITVPPDFAAARVASAGDAGRAWIAALPALVEELCQRWRLEVEGLPMHGYLGLVIPMRRDGELCALKVSWRDESNADEAAALATWNGQGAVRLLASAPEHAAMLLERLDTRRSLNDVAIEEAVAVASNLLRRLAIPAPSGFRSLDAVARDLNASLPGRWVRAGRPLPKRWVEQARAMATQLGASSAALLVNDDPARCEAVVRWLI